MLVATLSPKPSVDGDCSESEHQQGRVLELADETVCSTVLAVTVDEETNRDTGGVDELESVPELSPNLQDDLSAARSRKGSPLSHTLTDCIQIEGAKQQEDEAKRMKHRLLELEAANLAMAEQLSAESRARSVAADLINELTMSPGLLDSLGEIVSPELRCKLRATTSAGDIRQSECHLLCLYSSAFTIARKKWRCRPATAIDAATINC